jgi:hypothetical protein
MCRTAPNQVDKNPCANLCPEINEGLTKFIKFGDSEAKKRPSHGGITNFLGCLTAAKAAPRGIGRVNALRVDHASDVS